MRSKTIFALTLAVTALWLLVVAEASTQETLTEQEELGKNLFFDTNLSDPPGQACADCHGPNVGYTGPDQAINAAGAVYEGAVASHEAAAFSSFENDGRLLVEVRNRIRLELGEILTCISAISTTTFFSFPRMIQ